MSWATKLKEKNGAGVGAEAAGAPAPVVSGGAAGPASAMLAAEAQSPTPVGTAAVGGSSNAARSTLTYYLTLLRGSLVVVQLEDRSSYEGLLHTLDFGVGGASGTLVLQMVQRQPDAFASSHVAAPRLYESTRTGEPRNSAPFESVRKLPLSSVVQVFASDIDLQQWTVEYAEQQAAAKARMQAAKAGAQGGSVSGGARGFATDSAISGRDGEHNQRELVRWDGGSGGDVGELETFGSSGRGGAGFNQFETFERMTGNKSTFRFDDYSTPLDKSSAFYKANEARADAIAQSILSSTGSVHQRMEREGTEGEGGLVGRDRNADEGDLFSDVRREPASKNPNAYKPGDFARKRQSVGQVAGAAAETGTPRKSPEVASPAPGAAASPAAPASATAAAVASPAPAKSASPVVDSLAAQMKATEIVAANKDNEGTTPAAKPADAAAPATSGAAAPATDAAASAASSTSTSSTATSAAAAAAPVKSKLRASAKEFKMTSSFNSDVMGKLGLAPAPAAPAAPAPAATMPAGPMQGQQQMSPDFMNAAAAAGMFPGQPGAHMFAPNAAAVAAQHAAVAAAQQQQQQQQLAAAAAAMQMQFALPPHLAGGLQFNPQNLALLPSQPGVLRGPMSPGAALGVGAPQLNPHQFALLQQQVLAQHQQQQIMNLMAAQQAAGGGMQFQQQGGFPPQQQQQRGGPGQFILPQQFPPPQY